MAIALALPASALGTGTNTASIGVSLAGTFQYGTQPGGNVDVMAAPGDPVPTGLVTVYVCATKPCTTSGTNEGSSQLNHGAAFSFFNGLTPGSYCVIAVYSGDGTYAPGQSTGNDCFTVTTGPPHFVDLPSTTDAAVGAPVADQVTLFALSGDVETGTVTVSLCGPLASATGCTNGTTPIGTSTLDNGHVNSSPYTPTTTGWYCFEVAYGGDSNYNAGTDSSASNCFRARYSETLAQFPENGINYGNTTLNTITVTGAHGVPGGSVNFFACGPLTSASGCATGGQGLGSSQLSTYTASTSQGSVLWTPGGAGTWCYRAEYSGDSTYIDSIDSSTDGCFVVNKAYTIIGTTAPAGITLGGTVTESATVTGVAGGVDPTGTVTFSACGPNANGCATGGTQVGQPASLSPATSPNATATSDQFTPTAAGQWCIRATYNGDSNYHGVDNGSAANSTMCFNVAKAQSQSAAGPHDATITLGQSTTDSTTVTGANGAVPPSGNITFSACGPSATDCATGGTEVGQGTVALSPVGQTDTASATSSDFTPSAAGNWCFRADYPGDSNYLSSSDGAAKDQCFTVNRASPAITAAPQPPSTTLAGSATDTATVTGNGAGGSPTGDVSFFVCGPTAVACASGGTPLGTRALKAGPGNTATTTSPSFTPPAPGTWCFRAGYGGDANYTTASAGGSTQCFTVPKPNAPTASITKPATGDVYIVGQPITASYTCADSAGATGIASCAGPVANGAAVDTSVSAVGWHWFTVTATSKDGETSTSSVRYRVIRPVNQAKVFDIKTSPDGTVSFSISVPNPGAVDAMTTSWSNNFAHAAYLLQPAPHRFVFGRQHTVVPHAGTYRITVEPGASGRELVAHHRYRIHIRLWVSYTPTNGRQLNLGFYKIPVSR